MVLIMIDVSLFERAVKVPLVTNKCSIQGHDQQVVDCWKRNWDDYYLNTNKTILI